MLYVKQGSAVVRMFYVDVQWELRIFVLILIFILFAFSQSLYILGSSADLAYTHENGLTDDANKNHGNDFQYPDVAFLNAFQYMMGQSNFETFKNTNNNEFGKRMNTSVLTSALDIICLILYRL